MTEKSGLARLTECHRHAVRVYRICFKDICPDAISEDALRSRMWGGDGGQNVNALFHESSYGAVCFPEDIGSVETLRVERDLPKNCTNQAIDFFGEVPESPWPSPATHHVVFVIPAGNATHLNCPWHATANVNGIYSWQREQYSSVFQLAHEFGHNLGAWHDSTDPADENKNSAFTEYTDLSSVQGSVLTGETLGAFNAPHRYMLGWLQDASQAYARTRCAAKQTIRLQALHLRPQEDSRCGATTFRIPRSLGGEYFVSYRTGTGYDGTMRPVYQNRIHVHYWRGFNYGMWMRPDSQTGDDPRLVAMFDAVQSCSPIGWDSAGRWWGGEHCKNSTTGFTGTSDMGNFELTLKVANGSHAELEVSFGNCSEGLLAEYFALPGQDPVEEAFEAKVPNYRAPDLSLVESNVNYTDRTWSGRSARTIGARWSGQVHIQMSGVYTFSVEASYSFRRRIDVDSVLTIDGAQVSFTESTELASGAHDLELLSLRARGRSTARLTYRGPDTQDEKVVVPSAVLTPAQKATWPTWASMGEQILTPSGALACIEPTTIAPPPTLQWTPTPVATAYPTADVLTTDTATTDAPILAPTVGALSTDAPTLGHTTEAPSTDTPTLAPTADARTTDDPTDAFAPAPSTDALTTDTPTTLWPKFKGPHTRCKGDNGCPVVDDREACQTLAIQKGHEYYSFDDIRLCCSTTPSCGRTKSTNRSGRSWQVYKKP